MVPQHVTSDQALDGNVQQRGPPVPGLFLQVKGAQEPDEEREAHEQPQEGDGPAVCHLETSPKYGVGGHADRGCNRGEERERSGVLDVDALNDLRPQMFVLFEKDFY
jgi:hypothetical protein